MGSFVGKQFDEIEQSATMELAQDISEKLDTVLQIAYTNGATYVDVAYPSMFDNDGADSPSISFLAWFDDEPDPPRTRLDDPDQYVRVERYDLDSVDSDEAVDYIDEDLYDVDLGDVFGIES